MAENPRPNQIARVGQYKNDVVNVRFSEASLAEARAALAQIPRGFEKAAVFAVNKTLASARKMARQGLAKYLTIKRTIITQRVLSKRAKLPKDTSNLGNMSLNVRGRLLILGYKTPISNIKYRDTRTTGVYHNFVKGGPETREKSAFAATVKKSGKVQILRRLTNKRHPLARLYTDSLYDIYQTSPVKDDVNAHIVANLNSNMSLGIDKYLAIKSK